MPVRYEWCYLLVALDPRVGTLCRQRLERVRQQYSRPVLAAWDLDAVVWDEAGAHRGRKFG
jgi:hypothetical protein